MIHDTGSLENDLTPSLKSQTHNLGRPQHGQHLQSFFNSFLLPWGRLRTFAGEEVYVAALAVVGEGGDFDCLGVHNDDLGRVDSVVTDHRRQILQQ